MTLDELAQKLDSLADAVERLDRRTLDTNRTMYELLNFMLKQRTEEKRRIEHVTSELDKVTKQESQHSKS